MKIGKVMICDECGAAYTPHTKDCSIGRGISGPMVAKTWKRVLTFDEAMREVKRTRGELGEHFTKEISTEKIPRTIGLAGGVFNDSIYNEEVSDDELLALTFNPFEQKS